MTSPEATPPTVHAQPAESLVGKVLSERYKIQALLGEGGMGAVYLAEHVLMHKRLAVKVLHQEMTRMPEIVARFEREAMAAAHIEHPNVAAATDFGKLQDGAFFLVLEYVEGTSLRDLIAKGPMEVARSLHIAWQIASALARAHTLGIVHRDLKPENVMLVERDGDTDFVKVLDFGIAKVPVGDLARGDSGAASGQVLTQLGMVYGTPEYMAPEQALGQEVDLRADLYALGVMLYEMLVGLRPFDAENKVSLLGMKVTKDPPRPSAKNPVIRVPASVEALVMRLLDKEAEKRFQDAREVMDAIDAARIGHATTELPHRAATPLGAPASARTAIASRRSLASAPGVEGQALAPRLAGTLSRLLTLARTIPAMLPAGFGRLPVVALAVGAAFALLLVVVLVGSALRGPEEPIAISDGGPPPAREEPLLKRLLAPATAPADALSAATLAGASALEELAVKYPQDPAVYRALVKLHMSQKHAVEAMQTIPKLVALDEKAADEDVVQDAVSAAAQGQPEAQDAAFALMENGLGPKGPDILYELLMSKQTGARTLARVKQSLAKSDVRGRATPALAVAMDLKNAKGCDAKKGLLSRVKDQGDARSLALLRPLAETRGCGFLGLADCWSCMHRDGTLMSTMAALEEKKP
jgi:eukaryotic-like serine/threonine-protein kinase